MPFSAHRNGCSWPATDRAVSVAVARPANDRACRPGRAHVQPGKTLMTTRILAPLLALGLALPPALCRAETVHLLRAIQHTRAAIQAGNADNLPELLEQAALAHQEADASDAAAHNVVVENGEIMLEKALEKARQGKIIISVVYARDALINLERAAAGLDLVVDPPAKSTAPTGPSKTR